MSTNEVNLAMVGFDGAQLLIPQSSVATIEMIENLRAGDAAPGAIGFINAGDRVWPVFTLNAGMEICAERAPDNRYCVAFDYEGMPAFALTCDAVSSLELESADEIRSLQPCMQMPNSPVHALVLKEGVLMLVSRVEALRQFLQLDVEEAA